MTSGAIQHGVPTNVLRTLFRVMSPPVARKALTPKSEGRKERGERENNSTNAGGTEITLTYWNRLGSLSRVNEVTTQHNYFFTPNLGY